MKSVLPHCSTGGGGDAGGSSAEVSTHVPHGLNEVVHAILHIGVALINTRVHVGTLEFLLGKTLHDRHHAGGS